jgi:hypothetical protein
MNTRTNTDAALNRRDLLAGGIATLVALMSVHRVDAAARKRAAADPRHAFADRLSDLTIPATDTPGASDAQVAVFVLMAIDHRMGALEPVQLERVRQALDAACGGNFLAASRERQLAQLQALDETAFAPASAAGDSPGATGVRTGTGYVSEHQAHPRVSKPLQ